MKLTRLEAKGFKSFGDKIILHFGQGVTGIVGPNGCGKSNVVDAIRWVLGEQKTRNLRSDKMENIIFNGTAQRKPQQMAEVLLTFENDRGVLSQDYQQVTIGRRYHRGGESEYLINGVSCRLKDIENLFLDTGVGSDSYAIIELRMVDDILSDREGSRRGLFEEAAGISKYKQRKKETLRRLDDVQVDLERVEDLLHEVTRNLKSLEKQARQAERYFELKDRYRHLGQQAGRRTYLRREHELEKMEAQGKGLQTERDGLQIRQNNQEKHLEQMRQALTRQERELQSRQLAYSQKQEIIRQVENERNVSNERKRALEQRKDQLSAQLLQDRQLLQTIESRLFQLTKSVEEVKASGVKSQALHSGIADSVAKAEDAYKKAINESETTERDVRQADEHLRLLQREQDMAKTQAQTYQQELDRVQTRNQQQEADFVGFEEKLNAITTQLTKQQYDLVALRQVEEKRQAKEAQLQVRAEELREEISTKARRRDALQNEYNLTKSLQDNLEGYPEAIRFLRKNSNWSLAVNVPLVSDVLTVPEPYRVALEYYLEPYLNHYVVENEAEALKAIQLLANNNKGKASFLVLSRLPEKEAASQTLLGDEFIPALTLVECDPRYGRLAAHLLHQVYFTQAPAPVEVEGITVLAQDGSISRTQHSLAGGSVGLYEGKRIGRARNLEKLQADLQLLSKSLKELEEQQASTKSQLTENRATDRRRDLEQLQREGAKTEQEATAWRIRKEQSMNTLHDQTGRITSLSEELVKLKTDTDTRAPELARLQQISLQGQQSLQHTRLAQSASQHALNQTRQEHNQAQLEQMRYQNQVDQFNKEQIIRQEEQNRLGQRIEHNGIELKQTEDSFAAIRNAGGIDDEELKALNEALLDMDAGVKESSRKLFADRGATDAAEKELRELSRRREHNQNLHSEIATQVAGMQARLEAVAERIQAEFSTTPQLIEADTQLDEMPDEELDRQAQQTKDQLERLGPINPVAMESYKEMAERNDFIQNQKNDLSEARLSLETTINEIETEARRKFLATYEAIRTNFHQVFKSLFSDEDMCDLVLSQPDNPLESPIDIMARPKGKRPLTINQLSGGEKTLTAIALLFAIYLIKPAPFCIFDEVDAPLDDANIDKFNNIIRDFSANSQFIVVTHNKRTMHHADILYGITMVEQGVSRVIPVDLREVA